MEKRKSVCLSTPWPLRPMGGPSGPIAGLDTLQKSKVPSSAKKAVHIIRIILPSSSRPGHCDGIEEASTYAVKSTTSQQLLFNYDLCLEWPKPSSAASPHTPQPAVLFVDSEFASVSTYNVQGPCGADQTTIPRPPVTPSGA